LSPHHHLQSNTFVDLQDAELVNLNFNTSPNLGLDLGLDLGLNLGLGLDLDLDLGLDLGLDLDLSHDLANTAIDDGIVVLSLPLSAVVVLAADVA